MKKNPAKSKTEQNSTKVNEKSINSDKAESELETTVDDTLQSKEIDNLKTEVTALTEELKEKEQQILIEKANIVNLHKRHSAQLEKTNKFAVEKLAKNLLEVVDNLERALQAMTGNVDPTLVQGVELTYKSLLKTLESHSIKAIIAEGEPFNPELHEAIKTESLTDKDKGVIIAVQQKGYTIHERVLRPCLVTVNT